MTMQILSYEPEMADQMTQFYNAAIADVPHCYSVDVETFAPIVGGEHKHTRRLRRLDPEATCVAFEGDRVLGFVHAAPELSRQGNQTDRGVIRFLYYVRGRRDVGQALLEAAEAYVAQHGGNEIAAFSGYRYPCYHQASAGLSNRLDHVQALFCANGYQRIDGEVHFEWQDFVPVEPEPIDLEFETTVKWLENEVERPGLHLQAFQNGAFIGECGMMSCAENHEIDIWQDWLYVDWLGIEDDFQGQRLGKYLLQQAMKEMYDIGYRHASISCNDTNARAFAFYSNFGFRAFDWSYGFVCKK